MAMLLQKKLIDSLVQFCSLPAVTLALLFWFSLFINFATLLNAKLLFNGLVSLWCLLCVYVCVNLVRKLCDTPRWMHGVYWQCKFVEWYMFSKLFHVLSVVVCFVFWRYIYVSAAALAGVTLLFMVTGDGCNSGADGSGFGANNVPSGGTPSGGEVVAITVPTTSDDKEQPLYDVHIITPPAKELVLCGVVDLKDGCAVKQTLGLEGLNDEAFSLIRQSLMSCADMKQSHLESQVQLYFAEKLSLIEEALQNPKLDTYESEYFLKCRNQIKAGNFSFFKEKPFLFSRVPVCDPTFERGYIALISNRFESVCQPSYADLVAPERAFHPKLADHYNYNSTVIYNSNFYKLVSYGTSSNFAENAKLSVPYNIRGANQSQYITPFFCTRFDKSAGMLHTFSNDAFNFFKKPKNLAAIASAAATLKIICDHKMLNFNENDNFE